jgi:hypothetical protein
MIGSNVLNPSINGEILDELSNCRIFKSDWSVVTLLQNDNSSLGRDAMKFGSLPDYSGRQVDLKLKYKRYGGH